jgi:hypothetical protein
MTSKTTKSTRTVAKQPELAQTANAPLPSTEELHKMISQRAYERYLQRGGSYGNPVEDWLQAEREILTEISTPAPAPAAEAAAPKAKRAVRPKPAAVEPAAKPASAKAATKAAPKAPATAKSTRPRRKNAPEAPQG